MKIFKGILLTFMLLFCFSSNLFATEETNDVNAIYNYTKGDTFNDYVFENNKINVNLNGTVFDIITDNNSDNGLKITIIPTKDDALNWIHSITNLTDIKGFYVIFERVPSGNIKVSSSNKEKVLENISTDGEMLTTSQNPISVNNKSYIVFGNKIESNTINFNLDGNGSVIIEGVPYLENFIYKTNESSIDLIVKPNSEYEIDSIICDSINITNSLKGGFLTINDLKEVQNITITYKKREEIKENIYYKIIGTITKNGSALSNSQLELFSDVLKTTTDSQGNFIFEKVSLGTHSLTAYINNKVVGYIEFVLEKSNNSDIKISKINDLSHISVGNGIKAFDLTLEIDDDYKMHVDSVNKIELNNTYIWLIISGCIILLLAIIYLIRRKVKK